MRKVGIDTNILVRLLVDDDPVQRAAVLRFGDKLGKEYTGYVTLISLVEIDWALRSQYGFTRQQSIEAIRRVTQIRGVEIQEHHVAVLALKGVEDAGGDFADFVIAHLCLDAGCDSVASLDKKAVSKIPVMSLLS